MLVGTCRRQTGGPAMARADSTCGAPYGRFGAFAMGRGALCVGSGAVHRRAATQRLRWGRGGAVLTAVK
jgi:hypothetical protein